MENRTVRRSLKSVILKLAMTVGWVASLLPRAARLFLVKAAILIFSRVGKKKDVLKFILEIIDFATRVLNEQAMRFNNGIHPKHDLMNYASFFSENISSEDRVLDIGCGYGEVARRVAGTSGARVVGIDTDEEKIRQAHKNGNQNNALRFIHCKHDDLADSTFDAVILSNVLEHISDRVSFLESIRDKFRPGILLVRVPDYERSWDVPYRQSEGFCYFSDNDHKIEHTEEELVSELVEAGYSVEYIGHRWGELWVRAKCT